jgi:hypothetical protein
LPCLFGIDVDAQDGILYCIESDVCPSNLLVLGQVPGKPVDGFPFQPVRPGALVGANPFGRVE